MPTIESEPYENLRKLRDITTEDNLRALDEVKRFLLERRHIITGGQAIDCALRLKGGRIYDDNEVPDYDILTDKFHTEAYDLAQILHDKGFTNVSAINAMHPSTMRVFVNYTSVCDLTYVPKNLYDKLPTLEFEGFRVIHPHFQFIDQHRALSNPYENAPFIPVLHRTEKDMKRHDMLYSVYPLKGAKGDCGAPHRAAQITASPLSNSDSKDAVNVSVEREREQEQERNQYICDAHLLSGCCVSGYAALLFWLQRARELGYTAHKEVLFPMGPREGEPIENIITENEWKVNIPSGIYGFAVLTEAYADMIKRITKGDPSKASIIYREAILDKMPQRVLMQCDKQQWEIYDIKGLQISAFKPWESRDIWVANIQHLMTMFSTYYWYYKHKPDVRRAHKNAYLVCHDIVAWAAEQYVKSTSSPPAPAPALETPPPDAENAPKYAPFLPTEIVYGQYNWSSRYQLNYLAYKAYSTHNLSIKTAYALPPQVHMDKYNKVPKSVYEYDPKTSKAMQFSGKKVAELLSIDIQLP